MKKKVVVIAVAVVILFGVVAGYFYWQQQQPIPVQAKAPALTLSVPKPAVQQAVEAPVPAQPALPKLSESDKFILDALAELVGNKSLMGLFHTERVIHNIVATVDNLPRERAPLSVRPLKRVSGAFVTEGGEEDLVISAKNAARYAPYIKLAEAMDTKKLAGVYVRLYPLFQQAYEELGYPKDYFNDRLMEAIDDLLEAPDIKGPVKLVRPNVLYLYADPELEASSAGQKIIMRMGSGNAARVKARLRELKQEVMLHVQGGKVVYGQ